MTDPILKTIYIQASPSAVWAALTQPDLMKQWMGEPEMNIEVDTNWIVGSSFMIKGFHHVPFENRGCVLQFEPESTLSYNYLSSISHLPDTPENYTHVSVELVPHLAGTALKIEIREFPNEIIYRHVDFYWRTAIELLKKFAESMV